MEKVTIVAQINGKTIATGNTKEDIISKIDFKNQTTYICNICGKISKTKETCLKHKHSHLLIYTICPYCNYRSSKPEYMNKYHNDNCIYNPKNKTCKTCQHSVVHTTPEGDICFHPLTMKENNTSDGVEISKIKKNCRRYKQFVDNTKQTSTSTPTSTSIISIISDTFNSIDKKSPSFR